MYSNCSLCNKKILRHDKKIVCCHCNRDYHSKCITIIPEEIAQINANASEWLCGTCLTDIFPFNHIEDHEDYSKVLHDMFHTTSNLCFLSDKIFSPIDLNHDLNEYDMLKDLDPDVNFYNNIEHTITSKCKYYFEDMFNREINENLSNDFLSMIHLNIRSAQKNLNDFESYLHTLEIKFKIIALTESWFHDSNASLYNLPGYDLFEKHRSHKKGGGVALYVDTMYVCKHRPDLDFFNEHCESMFVEIDKECINMSQNVIIGVIYRIPNTDTDCFLNSMGSALDIIRKEKKICYLLGDYNLDLLNSESHLPTGEYIDLLTSQSFLPMINRPTRITAGSATIIDNIYTNNMIDIDNCMQGILITDISDHFPIFHINFKCSSMNRDTYITKRKYTSENKQSFLNELNEMDWQDVFRLDSTNDSFNSFHSILKKLHDKHFPKTKIKIRYKNNKPWLSDDLKESIKLKNKLYCISKKVPSVYNEENYRKFKNRLQHRMRAEEKTYYGELFHKYKGNMKKSWNLIKNIVYQGKKARIQSKFNSNGNIITDKSAIADKFNKFFTGIGPSLANAIPDQNRHPESYLDSRMLTSIFLTPVTEEEIAKIINELNSGAPGYDEIPASILKLSISSITSPLVHVCNLSLLEGIFPDFLKVANVVPLFKSGDPMSFNNYRPVSLLCVISKIFEKIMYTRLNEFLVAYKILYLYQFGFRKDHSSYMALMVLIDKLTECLENGDYVIGVYLDFSKAFDTVNHQILLSKLEHYGVRGTALSWFKSYLTNRTQYVTYDNVSSQPKNVSCGVPQGSILGPLLFLLYINDLSSVCKDAMSIFFADDSNLFKHGKDITKIEEDLNDTLANISEWLKVNKLSLNVKKTHYMIFSKKRTPNFSSPKINLKIDGEILSEVDKTKFLGVIIDNKLNWNEHVNYICGKIARGIGILLKTRNVLYKDTLTTLYYSFIYPYYIYCNQVWGCSTAKNIKRLHVLQKKAVRIICHVNPRSHSDPLFKELGLLNVWQINDFLIAQFMYKAYHGHLPSLFDSFFIRNCDVHHHETRQSAFYFNVIKVRTNYRKKSIRYQGPAIWNSLMKNNVSPFGLIYSFKRRLKDFLMNKVDLLNS